MSPSRGVRDAVYRPRYIALLDISSTPVAARDAVYRPQYIALAKFLQKKIDKVVELVGGGSVINGAYPV